MSRKNFKIDENGNKKQITTEGNIRDAKTDVNKTLQEAQNQHIINQYNKYMSLIESGEAIEGSRYLVRGAKLKCSCGSHCRKLNLPLCHGVYVSGKAMINEEDCLVGDDKNITTFGVCESKGHPDKTPFWLKAVGLLTPFAGLLIVNDERKKIILEKEDGTNVRGYACTPCIVSNWQDVHLTQRIARNDTDGTNWEDRLAAVTEDSFLVCAYGGLIEPVTSGQEEELDEKKPRRGGNGHRH